MKHPVGPAATSITPDDSGPRWIGVAEPEGHVPEPRAPQGECVDQRLAHDQLAPTAGIGALETLVVDGPLGVVLGGVRSVPSANCKSVSVSSWTQMCSTVLATCSPVGHEPQHRLSGFAGACAAAITSSALLSHANNTCLSQV